MKPFFLIGMLGMVAASTGIEAATFDDPTWPCVQRKVSQLSIGQMWTGEILEPEQIAAADEKLDVLAAALAVRRTSLLFALVFERIDSERAELIGGIGRYAGKQEGLAERISKQGEELAKLEAKVDRLEEIADQVDWDTRIFDERQQSLIYVCETPILLEKRAFALARMMMNHLDE